MSAVAAAPASLAPTCPYCGKLSVYLASSESVYGGRNFGALWICTPCGAWCGCHPGTNLPLGRLADATLRRAKMDVHNAFDPLWMNVREAYPEATGGLGKLRGIARSRAYAWLAERLGIPARETHIGMFDVVTCRRAIEIIEREKPTPASIRARAKARGEVRS